jgi:hypothetical protein
MMREHGRYQIWNQLQHVYRHNLSDFSYINEALPGVTNVEDALNYFSNTIYPNYKGRVDTVGDLPGTATIGDYYVVSDDGDGRAAGYRYEQREGDVSPSFYKIFDVDWSTDGILAALMDITQDVYVYQRGKTDLDANGDPVIGLFAGQRVWGGNLTGQNLTLDANSADATGFVQVNSNFRPTLDDTWTLGTATERFTNGYFSTLLQVSTLNIATGSITDTSGAISFGDENLSTSGSLSAGLLVSTTFLEMAEIATPANATAGSNRLYFKSDDKLYKLDDAGNETLVGLTFTSSNDNRIVRSDGTGGDAIQESGIIINDSDEVTGITRIDIDNIRIDGNVISTLDANGDLFLTPNGTGKVVAGVFRSTSLTNDRIFVPRTDGTMTSTGVVLSSANEISGVASLAVDNLFLDANTISTPVGDVNITPFTGAFNVSGSIFPDADGTRNIGSSSLKYGNIFIDSSISDGADSFVISELLDLRSANYRDFGRTLAAQAGDSLFYDAVNGVWLASAPDAEISHPTLANLTVGDSGHTQFVMLAGRSGGQEIIGGVSAGENLTLSSTSNVTKGNIVTSETFRPVTDAIFSAGWQGVDLGTDSFRFRNLYLRGEAFGLRPENVTTGTLPASSANNAGRLLFNTDNNKLYVDTGSSVIVAGSSKFINDIAFNGSELIKDVDVSSNILDARNAIIQLLDNSRDFERIIASIKATSASSVRITTNIALPAGSYRLIVME